MSKGFTLQLATLCCGPSTPALECPLLRLMWLTSPLQFHSGLSVGALVLLSMGHLASLVPSTQGVPFLFI